VLLLPGMAGLLQPPKIH